MFIKTKRTKFHRVLSAGISFVLASSMMPAFPAWAADYPDSVPTLTEEEKRIPDVKKAGSIPASEDTITYEQPFAPFTAGCENFRIPTLLTIQNGEHKGTLVASGDARWEEWNDGGGIDSIASISDDGGKTWNYSFPIYFPDSYGYSGRAATTIIDPGVVEGADGTLYFIADVNPTGSTTMYKTIGTGSGYVTVNGERYQALTQDYNISWNTTPTDDNLTNYPYYVDSFDEDGFAQILKREDSSGTGYGVDEWFNLYEYENGEYKDTLERSTVVNDSSKKIQQNCFYKDSMFHVYSIDYLWVVQSKDGGRTWEHPRDITDQIKRPASTGEGAILVSPGKGIVTSEGDSVIGIYNTLNNESASMLYTKDGKTWKRTQDVQNRRTKTSENEIVELKDGTLRMFYRSNNGKISYADITKDENEDYVMGSEVETDVNAVSNCNVSVISYSEEIEGKQMLLVSCPGSGSGSLTGMSRANGKIFVFLVDDSDPANTMTLYHTFSVPGGETGFVYSCLTELEDGRVGMLWEPNHSTMYFDTYHIDELISDAVSVELKKDGEPYAFLCGSDVDISESADKAVAKVEKSILQGEVLCDHVSDVADSLSSFSSVWNSDIAVSDAEMTFTRTETENTWKLYNEFSGKYFTNEKDAGTMFKTEEHEVTVTSEEQSDGTVAFRIKDGSRPLFFYTQNMDFNAQGSDPGNAALARLTLLEKQDEESADDVIPGYTRASEIKDGGKYLITWIWTDGSVFVLYPENGSTAAHTKLLRINPDIVKITGVGAGETSAVINGTLYKISVEDAVTDKNVTLEKEETYFIPAQDLSKEPSVKGGSVKIQKIDRIKEGLFDHVSDEPFSTDGYGMEAHKGLTLADAEFTFTATDTADAWNISHDELYLSNPERAEAFFSETADKIKVERTDAGKYYLSRAVAKSALDGTAIASKNGGVPIGILMFYYREMNFRSYGTNEKKGNVSSAHGGNLYGTHADYALTLFEKKSQVSAEDVLPGYQEAEEITDGGKYLIAYIWNDSVFVLYPENGFGNSTKLVNPIERGFLVTADARGGADVTVENVTYHFDVTDTKLTESENTLKALLAQAETAYKNQSVQMASWQEFKAAYEEAKKLLENPAEAEVSQIEKLFAKLNAAFGKLEAEKKQNVTDANKPGIEKGHVVTINNISYEVTDLSAKTVSVAGGTAKKANIPSSVAIGDSVYKVTAIQAKAFKGSKNLQTVKIGSSVTNIGNYAFSGCGKLKTVTIGKNVKTIGKKAFYNSKKLTKVTVQGKSKLSKVNADAFKKTSPKISIKLPKDLKKKSGLIRQIKKAGIKKGLK